VRRAASHDGSVASDIFAGVYGSKAPTVTGSGYG